MACTYTWTCGPLLGPSSRNPPFPLLTHSPPNTPNTRNQGGYHDEKASKLAQVLAIREAQAALQPLAAELAAEEAAHAKLDQEMTRVGAFVVVVSGWVGGWKGWVGRGPSSSD